VGGYGAEKPYQGHRPLLRARRERPSCRAAKKRDELAPPHGAHPKAKDHTLIIAQCIAAKSDPSSRHLETKERCLDGVRFTSISRNNSARLLRRVRAHERP